MAKEKEHEKKHEGMGHKRMGKEKGMMGKKEAGFSARVGKGKHGFGKDVSSPAKD